MNDETAEEAHGIERAFCERLAARIEEEGTRYDQRRKYSAEAGADGAAQPYCIMGHAAQMAGAAAGIEPARIEAQQRRLAATALNVDGDGWTALFAAMWPVEWFLESGAATMADLRLRDEKEVVCLEGTPRIATPRKAEAVTVLRWIGKRGGVPGENGKDGLPNAATTKQAG